MTRTFDLRRALWVAVVAVVTVSAAFFTAVPEAQAQDRGPLRNFNNTRMCIGIDHGSTADGAPAKLFPCDGRPNQSYTFLQLGGGVFLIQAGHSGKCLYTATDLAIVQFRCDRNDTKEYFVKHVQGAFFALGGADGCIGYAGAPRLGTPIHVHPCSGRGDQLWRR